MSRDGPAMLCPLIWGQAQTPSHRCGDCTEDLCLQAMPVSLLSKPD